VLALLATGVRGVRARVAALVVAWIVVVGPPPLPDRVDLTVKLFFQSVVMMFSVAVVGSPRPRALNMPAVPAGARPATAE
jgi:hypothetical protein